MSTLQSSTLTASELDLLLSLSDSDSEALESFLKPATKEMKASILAQMDRRLTTRTADLTAMPMQPTVRQADFLSLTCREALYGGAAGGGKSEGLLMWLAEGVGIPNYSGIIFRRTAEALANSNDSLIAKAMRMYLPFGGAVTESGCRWRFPSGAMIELGGLQHETSVEKHQGPSYHRIAFDELTHFTESQYEFLVLTRIRSEPEFPIYKGARGASNPGGIGHDWVKRRFITDAALDTLRKLPDDWPCPPGLIFVTEKGRAFVPARLADNPHIDQDDYRSRMEDVTNPVMKARMLNGDWSVMPHGLIDADWLISGFTTLGEYILLFDKDGKRLGEPIYEPHVMRLMTVDTAGSGKDIDREAKGKQKSYHAVGIWNFTHVAGMPALILRHVWRDRCDFTKLVATLKDLRHQWNITKVMIEAMTHGQAAVDSLRASGIYAEGVHPSKDKVTRATSLLNMLSRGQVFLPQVNNDWLPELVREWLSWRGEENETNDQVDMAAYAALECDSSAFGVTRLDFDPISLMRT